MNIQSKPFDVIRVVDPRAIPTGTAEVIYTVPEGETVIVINTIVVNADALLAGLFELSLNGGPGATTRIIRQSIPADDSILFAIPQDGFILNSGDTLSAVFGNASGTISIFGRRIG